MKIEQNDQEPACVAKTLDWCNAKRKEQGKPALTKLPKGRRDDPESCPCGKATGYLVHSTSYSLYDGGLGICYMGQLPIAVMDFVAAFDSGELPEYEA